MDVMSDPNARSSSLGTLSYNLTGADGNPIWVVVPINPTESVNTIWVLICGFLVLLMQLGFSMLEAGTVGANNTKALLFKNFYDLVVGAIAWMTLGYGFAFGDDYGGFIGTTRFFMSSIDVAAPTPYAHFFFQLVFSATAATIDSGSVAERMDLTAYALSSFMICVLVYPIACHWVWHGDGWLASRGFLDFAGSSVVHTVGGSAALVGAWMLGPRLGRYDPVTREPNDSPRQSVILQAIGTWLLFFGWFGFNTGSTLGIWGASYSDDSAALTDPDPEACVVGSISCMSLPEHVSLIAVNTLFGGVYGAFAATTLARMMTGQFDLENMFNGLLTGLVSITAGCAFVTPGASVAIGLVGGTIYIFGSQYILRRLFIDDPLDAITVHGLGGTWGIISIGLFHETDGLFYGGSGYQLGIQTAGILAIILWTVVLMYLTLLGYTKLIGPIRVSKSIEESGCDCELSGGPAYYQATEAKNQTLKKGKHLVDELLVSPIGTKQFYRLLKEKKCEEILQLYVAIKKFERKPFPPLEDITKIYETFIRRGAPFEANLPSWVLKSIAIRRGVPSKTIFKDAKSEVMKMLKEMCDRHFINSDAFQEMMNAHQAGHNKFIPLKFLENSLCLRTSGRYGDRHVRSADMILEEARLKSTLCDSILILGSGETGKSTLMKQVALEFGVDISADQVIQCTEELMRNAISTMQVLNFNASLLGYKPDTEDERAAFKYIGNSNDEKLTVEFNVATVNAMDVLWKSEFIKKTYDRRSEYWILEAASYYMKNARRFLGDQETGDPFSPSISDFLMARVKTTGAHETTFTGRTPFVTTDNIVAKRTFRFIDVGGQRSERRKWLQYFEDVDQLLFMVNLNAYHAVLFEDASLTSMHETIALVDELFNGKNFKHIRLSIAFNKIDLFEECFDKERFCAVFTDAPDNIKVDGDVKAAAEYVKQFFLDKLKAKGYEGTPFVMTATSIEDVRAVVSHLTSSRNPAKEAEATTLLQQRRKRRGGRHKQTIENIRPSRFPGVDHDFTGTNARERWRLRQEARGGSKVVQGTQDGKLSMERSASHQSFASTSTNGTVANHEINDEFDMIYEL